MAHILYVYVSVSENENAYAKNVDIFGAWDEFLCVFRCQTLGLCTFSSYSSVYVAFTIVGCVFVTSKKIPPYIILLLIDFCLHCTQTQNCTCIACSFVVALAHLRSCSCEQEFVGCFTYRQQ